MKLKAFKDVTKWPEVKPFKKAIKEEVVKEVDGPGAHLKVTMSANWPKPVDPKQDDPTAAGGSLSRDLYYTYSSARSSPDITRHPRRIVSLSLEQQQEETPRRLASSPSKMRGA